LSADRTLRTYDSYAYCFQLLVCFAAGRLGVKPSQIEMEQINAPLVLAFLEHLEQDRKNSARTRNAWLASSLDQSHQIHGIPMKKTDEALVAYLTPDELRALLDAPDPHVIAGVRDRAMLNLAFAAGLRVSELVGLRFDQLDLRTPPSIHIIGKGQRERRLPLWKETTALLRA
jgi:integrase/recombinase XerD